MLAWASLPEDAIFWSPREVVVRGLAAEPWYDYMYTGWSEEGYEYSLLGYE